MVSKDSSRSQLPLKSYKDWHISLAENDLLLFDARQSLADLGAASKEIPLLIQMVENPVFHIPGLTIFHGAVNLLQHDCIHILLGRGLLPMDEAFVIGFTMGSTCKVSTHEEILFSLISKYLYPKLYRFSDDDIAVFKDAVRLGYISHCKALDTINFDDYMSMSIAQIRKEVGLEEELLAAYYKMEQLRYPDSLASIRLLSNNSSGKH